METLSEKQRRFTRLVSDLIAYAYAQGYELTFGEAYRTPEQAALNAKNGKGIANSLHTQRLAIDLNLFYQGEYLTDSAAYRPLGLYWEQLEPDCFWGGLFKDRQGNPTPDGNHFSIGHEGRK